MKITIDARTLETGHKFRGIGVYAQNLIQKISEIDFKNQYIFLTQSKTPPVKKIIKNRKFQYKILEVRKTNDPENYNWYLDQIYLPLAIKKSQADVVHFLDQLSCPFIRSAKTVVSILDLMQIFPGYKSQRKNKIKLSAAKRADKIITISEASKDDIVKKLNISQEKIKVTYMGYDKKIFKPIKDKIKSKKFRQKLLGSRAEKYFFYSGSFTEHEPRKNIDFLIEMFIRFTELSAQKNVALVLNGKEGEESKRIKYIAKKRKIEDKIIFNGFASTSKLASFLQASEALLFPSLCEGFGLPPLAAMASGTPVISSNRSSLPEVLGGAGILIDPEKIPIWIDSMNKILRDENYKNKLIEKGLEQAKKFSWEKCAKETIETYKEVCHAKN